jgi:hypothetical protein
MQGPFVLQQSSELPDFHRLLFGTAKLAGWFA